MNENHSEHSTDGEPVAGDAATAETDAAARPEPTQPVEDELTAAARAAQTGPYTPDRHFKPPNTMLILIGILILLVGFGSYGIVWMRGLSQRNDQIRLRHLEKRAAEFNKQESFYQEHGYMPAGKEVKPLNKAEQAELEALREAYGQYDPEQAPHSSETTLPVEEPGGG